jgi:isoquinoline 1-oxidoreductase
MGKAAKVIEGEYLTSLNIHAPLEPMNALAMEENGTWHIYTGNQFNTRTTLIAAAVAVSIPRTSSSISIFWAAASGAGWSRT